MPLTVAAWRDICLMMLQDQDYEAHMSNTASQWEGHEPKAEACKVEQS